MKNVALFLIGLTTVYLVFFIAFCQVATSFTAMNVLFIIGNVLIVVMVYKVLKDVYNTSKTFKDWYEDHSKIVEKS
ncbi:hypothetical protein [Flavobacterium sp. TSSA_36]|jgi:uncharacterized membrane protein YqjE|uniref:hypothetical protein n=1 Tax=Flavobacterium sp. TSSA_36 TaxID=3447669 RepID=UPI003F3A7FE2